MINFAINSDGESDDDVWDYDGGSEEHLEIWNSI